MGRIEWHSSSMGGTNGFVNGKLLFNVCYGISQPPHGNDQWVLTSELPVATSKGHETEEVAKERAERVLERFVRSLGATVPPESAQPPVALEGAVAAYFEAWWIQQPVAVEGTTAVQWIKGFAARAFEAGYEKCLEDTP